VAEYYYKNPYLDWLIYLSNEVVDPYYDWYVRDDQLESLMIAKYGSVENAKKKIKYFVNNWYLYAEEEISTSHYEDTLARPLKKYYDPVFSENLKIIAYRRKRTDEKVNTNRVVDYTITYTSGNSFTSGELVDVFVPGEQIANGEVVFSNSSVVRIQSVFGNTFANSSTSTYLVGETSSTNAAASSSNTVVINITDEEAAFWAPVYYYDYEVMKNEEHRTINLVGSDVSGFLVNDFVSKISNT
jgi:hypothetical protein